MLMTPGPTAVPEPVRDAMSRELIHPDVDPRFREIYDRLTDRLARVYGVDTDASGGDARDVVALGGEGILGLEAAVASLVEPGTEVLCLSNGLYGEGFADFVESYGGTPTLVAADHDEPLPVDALDEALAGDEADFDIATMVHCETPTGALNDVTAALDRIEAADAEVLTVVDAVSSLGGVSVPTDRIDVCLGASQKCFSAPPGLATAAVSERAWAAMEERDPHSLYANFLPFRDVSDGFPYTHLTTEVVALDAALGLLLDEGLDAVRERHEAAAARCRERGAELGLESVPDPERSSPTVTAFEVPGRAEALQERLREEHDVILATGLGEDAGDVLRVGHMGHNARVERVDETMDALAAVL
ncbi:aminotransferase class V-fold PLP-dependent enzyme [Halorubrum ezzemoulense]|uniref:pyridoxal-phosphate-dependent aminotransferase family protein n=1 Tax=Halorubrum ezzemoulense TaxID=337243 RepID=UPI00232BA108|nr:aminotransferase class V-fold PLP-dependent enzyme [Halorubrum ezzemoulense]MDB2261890.1 aminotransferase class V-fold PLP-dependent enzyme [Halorubrum ezzemoulense]MDB2268773.1 aminotransferase class V-fold PLP-dependent enzyme [Halorubrum ezzemoulense]